MKFNTKKHRMLTLISILSLPVVLFFQNCSQQGSLAVTSAGLAGTSNSISTNDFQIPTDTPPTDGGMVIVPPADPTTTPTNPPATQPGTGGSTPPQAGNPPSDPSVSSPPVVNPPITEPPVVSNPPVNPPVNNPPVNPPTTQPPQQPPSSGGGDTVSSQGCRNIEIADIKLSVDSVSSGSACSGGGGKKSAEFSIVGAALVTLNNPTLTVHALKSGEVKQLFVQLNATGNQILSMDNIAMNLVTPSAQQSGLKVQLNSSVQLIAGKDYVLKFDIHPEDQIVANPVKCLMKPVIKSATLMLQ